jgi:hypothetical protein
VDNLPRMAEFQQLGWLFEKFARDLLKRHFVDLDFIDDVRVDTAGVVFREVDLVGRGRDGALMLAEVKAYRSLEVPTSWLLRGVVQLDSVIHSARIDGTPLFKLLVISARASREKRLLLESDVDLVDFDVLTKGNDPAVDRLAEPDGVIDGGQRASLHAAARWPRATINGEAFAREICFRAVPRDAQRSFNVVVGGTLDPYSNGAIDLLLQVTKVESGNVCGLGCELRVSRDAPTSTALQRDVTLAQDSPNLIVRDVGKRLGQKPSSPGAVSFWRRRIQHRQNSLFSFLIVRSRRTRSGLVAQSRQPLTSEARTLLADSRRAYIERNRNLLIRFPGSGMKNELRAIDHSPLGRPGASDPLKLSALAARECNSGSNTTHVFSIA